MKPFKRCASKAQSELVLAAVQNNWDDMLHLLKGTILISFFSTNKVLLWVTNKHMQLIMLFLCPEY